MCLGGRIIFRDCTGRWGKAPPPPPPPPPVLYMGHIIGAYTYISVHTKGHIDDFIDRQGLGGFFCWGGGGLGWITGEGASVSGDKHIFNGWRGGGGGIIFVITVNHVAVLIIL